MLTIEDVRVGLFVLGFFVLCFGIIAYAWRNPKGAIKLLCLVAVVALGLIGIASAEDKLFDEITVSKFEFIEAAVDRGEPCLRIWFNYKGESLSWYDDEFLPGVEYKVVIFAGNQVNDAEPILEPKLDTIAC